MSEEPQHAIGAACGVRLQQRRGGKAVKQRAVCADEHKFDRCRGRLRLAQGGVFHGVLLQGFCTSGASVDGAMIGAADRPVEQRSQRHTGFTRQ